MTVTVHALTLGALVASPILVGHVLYLARPIRIRDSRDRRDH